MKKTRMDAGMTREEYKAFMKRNCEAAAKREAAHKLATEEAARIRAERDRV